MRAAYGRVDRVPQRNSDCKFTNLFLSVSLFLLFFVHLRNVVRRFLDYLIGCRASFISLLSRLYGE